MTAALALPAPTPEITVPREFAEAAFEYKLGIDSAEDEKAHCPINRGHLMFELRRDAWRAGRIARRRELGLKVRHLMPLQIIRRRATAEVL
jgi:hypothetical protein